MTAEQVTTSILKSVEAAVTIKAVDHVHWYDAKRWQGIGMMVIGVGLSAVPYLPDSVGLFFIGTGWSWWVYGAGKAVERNS